MSNITLVVEANYEVALFGALLAKEIDVEYQLYDFIAGFYHELTKKDKKKMLMVLREFADNEQPYQLSKPSKPKKQNLKNFL